MLAQMEVIVDKALIIVSMFAFTLIAVPQEVKHAPTLQNCAADLNLWTSQISGWPTPTDEQEQESTKSLSVREMRLRASSIGDCTGAYPALMKARPNELPATFSLVIVYDRQIKARLWAFLDRHGLSDKFMQEDDEGKR